MSPSLLGEINTKLENLPRRERDNLRQRREILDAALRLFSERGYHNVSMHEIAGEAQFGMGTLYKYFSNKEDLYKALIMGVGQEFHQASLQAIEQEQEPLRAVQRYIAVRRKLFSDNLPIVRLYYAETKGASFNMKAGLDQDLLKLYDEGIEKLASVFDEGIKEHVFRDLDPHQMALALEGTINALLFEFMKDPSRVHEEDILSTAMDIFLGGVLSK